VTPLLADTARRVSPSHCLLDPGDHRLAQKQIHEVWIELGAAAFANRAYSRA
jgi:hypothetical protein